VIPLILALRFPKAKIYGIEVQDDLAQLAVYNVHRNRMEDRVKILHGDLRQAGALVGEGVADVVCTNPPYRPVGSGRLSPNAQRTIAKHEVRGTLFDVVSAARTLLKPSGCLWMVYPASRLVDVVTQMRACLLEPKQLRLVYSRYESEAELVVAKACEGAKAGVSVLPALVTHRKDGGFTQEMAALIDGG
jgi:tRNA1Val (adenine37-N6)-methyltransferase